MEKPITTVLKPNWLKPGALKRLMIIRYGEIKLKKLKGTEVYQVWKKEESN